jgi:NAD(P)-dependent dehydrogenase (short-subunit alcohol dehydrogenase family)
METNRVAIVTAAGKGIGAAIARELAEHGYSLALMSNSGGAKAMADDLGGVAVSGSVTENDDLRKLVDLALDNYGRIDAVVNNTGHPAKGRLLDITDEDWHEGLDLLLLNVIRMARLVTPIMKQQGGGAIVNISTFAVFEPDHAFPVSSSLRAALAGFCKLYADQHAVDGIRMNNLLPGFMDNYPEREATVNKIPMGRYAKVSEIAKSARFLLEPSSAYITGQNIRADGGITRAI